MNHIFAPADVHQMIGALYGPTGWAGTLESCAEMLATEPFICQSEIPGRLQALALAGHNREALLAVALAFSIVPEEEA